MAGTHVEDHLSFSAFSLFWQTRVPATPQHRVLPRPFQKTRLQSRWRYLCAPQPKFFFFYFPIAKGSEHRELLLKQAKIDPNV
jgi:hypothetical protein